MHAYYISFMNGWANGRTDKYELAHALSNIIDAVFLPAHSIATSNGQRVDDISAANPPLINCHSDCFDKTIK